MTRIALTVLCALALSGLSAAQTIDITSVPAYGTAGNLTGVVTGVNPNTHSVAVYIYIEGAGWWIKPSDTMPHIPIQANGTFSANVVSGGIDDRATTFFVALIPPGGSIPPALGANSIPSGLNPIVTDVEERFDREIQFAGRTWGVKEAPVPVGPGGNRFSSDPNDVWVDASGRLHMRIRWSSGSWRCSEVILKESLGHGTYWFTTESEVEDLDPAVVFGAFTWDIYGDDFSIPTWPNREIDFEDSRWGNPGDPTTSQVVVQPWDVAGNLVRYTTPDLSADPLLSRWFIWRPTSIGWVVARGRHTPCDLDLLDVVHISGYTHNPSINHLVPPAGRERMRFNLWLNNGASPWNGQVAEVIISDFQFSPEGNLFPTRRNANPATLEVSSGMPSIGTTVTVDVDDPGGTVTPGASCLLVVTPVPTPDFPNGVLLPGLGFGGADIELQVALNPTPFILPGTPWFGPGAPVSFPIAIPPIPALAGLVVYAQGALFDGTPAIGLTGAMQLCISL